MTEVRPGWLRLRWVVLRLYRALEACAAPELRLSAPGREMKHERRGRLMGFL
jgi:hypothetical protein